MLYYTNFMQETQIKVEYNAFKELFPIYIKLLLRKEKIKLVSIKSQSNKSTLIIETTRSKRTQLVEKMYNFNNLFKIQKIEYEY